LARAALALALTFGLTLAACDSGDGLEGETFANNDYVANNGGANNDDNNAQNNNADAPDPIHVEVPEGCNPMATSDECILPFPSAYYQKEDASSPTGVRMNYDADKLPFPDGATKLDMGPLNRTDGASPLAPILVHFGEDVDLSEAPGITNMEDSLDAGSPIVLFNLDTKQKSLFFAEMDQNSRSKTGRHALILRPMEPLQMGARYVVAMTKDLKGADGEALPSPAAFEALRDRVVTDNAEVEGLRGRYEELFAFLSARGYEREDLLLAWDFTVASKRSVLGPITSMREQTLEVLEQEEIEYEITRVEDDPRPETLRVIEGNFFAPTFLKDDRDLDLTDEDEAVLQPERLSVPFTMIIPRAALEGEPLPLTVFGHGLFGVGREYLAGGTGDIIQPLANEYGTVMIATNWSGLSGADFDRIVTELVPNLNNIGVVTDRLAQSLINNVVMTRLGRDVLGQDEQVWDEDHALIDADRTWYYGVSLGGIQGASLTAISPDIQRAILSVPGCMWTTMLTRSIHWNELRVLFDAAYPDPLLQQLGFAMLQTRFDHSDPGNLATMIHRDPLPGAPQDRRVILQEAVGDSQVPNITTHTLARAMGVPFVSPAVKAPPHLPSVRAPYDGSALVQYLLPGLTPDQFPPDSNTPPEDENGAHAGILFLDSLQGQIEQFILTGEVHQLCDGACDPD
jgi:hypothetical protein